MEKRGSAAQADDIVIGLLFGDEGKGTTVSQLCSQNKPNYVIRFSGGPQTAHNVIHDGIHHTFAQLGSGSLQRVPTILTRYMLINPFNLMHEGAAIIDKTGWNPFSELLVSENALLITPVHRWLNQQKEIARGENAHGSCGEGVGDARYYDILHPESSLKMGDLRPANFHVMRGKLESLISYAEETVGQKWASNNDELNNLMRSYRSLSLDGFLNIVEDSFILDRIRDGYNVWEGSQGVLLDESLGFFPHTTWSRVTPANAQELLKEAGKKQGNVIGVIRSYFTRHGHGPFPSEIENTDENVQLFPETHNKFGQFQGGWRRGWFDFELFDYAVRAAGGIDELSITHADKFFPNMPAVLTYENMPYIPADFYNEDFEKQEMVTQFLMSNPTPVWKNIPTLEKFFQMVSEVSEATLRYVSYGPTTDDKEIR